mmetsp:Transcript_2816/g.8605  ORF Transcript_2816/g.8605 Transcript_2816/m.8605 type:complete len:266 (-) Transcript_2816:208-1005(-)
MVSPTLPGATCSKSLADRLSLTSRRCVVTGGNRGLGIEISLGLMHAGAEVAVISRNGPDKDAAERLSESGKWHNVQGDLDTTEGTLEVADKTLAALGKVDVLVNNAGVAMLDPLEKISPEVWDKTMAINLRAPFLLAQKFVPGMMEQRAGKIVNVSSLAGVDALDQHGAYCTSKAGLNMLTKMMTVEWAKYNIQANAICPTVILTDMGKEVWGKPETGDPMKAKIPLGRFGEPVEVADAVVFLASNASDLICGQSICLDGGYSVQ